MKHVDLARAATSDYEGSHMTRFTDPDWVRQFTGHIAIGMICTLSEDDQAAFYAERKDKPPGTGTEVRVIIDGKEFDFELFAKRVEQQLDREIVEKAGELLKTRVFEMLEPLQDSVDKFADGLKAQAAEMLGYNPWDQDR